MMPIITNANEIGSGDGSAAMGAAEPTPQAQAISGTCTSVQIQENQSIIQRCNANWESWGISPPPANEMRELDDCSGVVSTETLLGCGDAILALPLFLGELAVMGMAATFPVDRNTFAYVSQNGSLTEIKNFLTGEFFQEQCGLYPWQEGTYSETACPDRNSHLNPESHRVCRDNALQRLQRFNECRNSADVRSLYRARRASLDSYAQSIKAEQDRRRQLEERHSAEISRIRSTCRLAMNNLSGSAMLLYSPAAYLASQAQTRIAPSQSQIQSYTDCVARETEGSQSLRDELANSADGLVAQISRSFSSIQCYNGRIRKALTCEVALAVLSGGAALTASAARRLGRQAVEEFSERLGRNSTNEIAAEAIEETGEASDIAAVRVGRANEEVLNANSRLSDVDRIVAAQELVGDLTPEQSAAIIRAHEVGANRPGAGYGNYTLAELREKNRILADAGLNTEQRRTLMDNGIVGQMAEQPLDSQTMFRNAYATGDFNGDAQFVSGVFSVSGQSRRLPMRVVGRNPDGSLEVVVRNPDGSFFNANYPSEYLNTVRLSTGARSFFEAVEQAPEVRVAQQFSADSLTPLIANTPAEIAEHQALRQQARDRIGEANFNAITNYTYRNHEVVNRQLRSGMPCPDCQALQTALSRLPVHEGISRRLTSMPDDRIYQQWLTPGQLVSDPAFFSTTTNTTALPRLDHLRGQRNPIRIEVVGRSGRILGDGFSAIRGEGEVLFPPNTNFIVESVWRDPDGIPIVRVREVTAN